jgi:hypothetical protein
MGLIWLGINLAVINLAVINLAVIYKEAAAFCAAVSFIEIFSILLSKDDGGQSS